jgi:hypothetical protein
LRRAEHSEANDSPYRVAVKTRGRSPDMENPGPSKPNEHFLPGVAVFYT